MIKAVCVYQAFSELESVSEREIEPDPRMVELSHADRAAGRYISTDQYLDELRKLA